MCVSLQGGLVGLVRSGREDKSSVSENSESDSDWSTMENYVADFGRPGNTSVSGGTHCEDGAFRTTVTNLLSTVLGNGENFGGPCWKLFSLVTLPMVAFYHRSL